MIAGFGAYFEQEIGINKIIGSNMSDYEKALSIYDYICSTTTYDSDRPVR